MFSATGAISEYYKHCHYRNAASKIHNSKVVPPGVNEMGRRLESTLRIGWITVVLALLTWRSASSVQAANAGWTFAEFQSAVVRLDLRAPTSSTAQSTLQSISDELQTIRNRYVAVFGADSDTEERIAANLHAEFSQSMVDDLWILNHLPADPAKSVEALQAVRRDLSVKARSASSNSGIVTLTFPSIIDVAITVKLREHQTINPSDLSIHANSCGRGTSLPGRVLGNGTGPFLTKLPPGCFIIWAQVGNSILKQMEQDVGLSSSKPEKFDFLL